MRVVVLFNNVIIGLAVGATIGMATFARNDPQPILLVAVVCAPVLALFNELALRSDERRQLLKQRRVERRSQPRIPQTSKQFAERLHSYSVLNSGSKRESETIGACMTFWCNVDVAFTASTPPKSSEFIRSILHRNRAILNR